MASILIREADANGLKRFKAVPEGQGIRTGNVTGPFYYRPVIDGRQLPPKRLKSAAFAEAKVEADNLPNKIVAQELGVQPEQLRGNRVPIVTAVQKYLEQKSSKAPRTLAQYRTTLEQFISILKSKAHFLDEIDEDVLRHFKKALEAEGYAGKTIDTRLNIVFFLLKKNGIKARIPADEMPIVEEEPATPYSDTELRKLWTEIDKHYLTETVNGKEYSGPGFGAEVRYKFFLGSGCRDREVTFAAWSNINFDRKEYTVRSKQDVGFTVKNHEARTVPLPDSLIKLLELRKANAPDERWIFVNTEGGPENHFLDKLKRIARDAGMNCGHCVSQRTEGRHPSDRRKVTVTCKTHAVCEHIYLHRFRKTCATRWLNNGVGVRTIQHYLGHKDLETTMKYLGVEDSQAPEHRTKINKAFGD